MKNATQRKRTDMPDEKPVGDVIQWLRKDIGISAKFFDGIKSDDDWSTVIKLHAMIEAGLNHLLITQLGDKRLADIISRFDTGDRQRGKLAFVKELELLSGESRNFIEKLSSLRNKLVHDVKNFDFSFPKWIEGMASADRKNLNKYASEILRTENIVLHDKSLKVSDAILSHPKYMITLVVYGIMITIFERNPSSEQESASPDQAIPKE